MPVTAVGDPHQSIYGWRGASAGNLERFPTTSPTPRSRPGCVPAVDELAQRRARSSTRPTTSPAARAPRRRRAGRRRWPPAPGAGRGSGRTARLETLEEEARRRRVVAPRRRRRRRRAAHRGGAVPQEVAVPLGVERSAATRHPRRGRRPRRAAAAPEVVDLVGTARVVHDPTAATGADAAARRAAVPASGRRPRRRSAPGRAPARTARREAPTSQPTSRSASSIVEALDDAAHERAWVGADKPGDRRLSPSSGLLGPGGGRARLRALTGLSLPELVAEAERGARARHRGAGARRAGRRARRGPTSTPSPTSPPVRRVRGPGLARRVPRLARRRGHEERGLDLGWIERAPTPCS